jgi:dolichol-phosphate mannosyltransferase
MSHDSQNVTSDHASTTDPRGLDIPLFAVPFSRPRTHRYAICVFVINEGEKVRKQLAKMKESTDRVDVIVADGGSTDGSFERTPR